MSNTSNQFTESLNRFNKWRNENEKIIGLCLWEIEVNDNVMLSCWTHSEKGVVIFMIFSNGNGFQSFSYDKDL